MTTLPTKSVNTEADIGSGEKTPGQLETEKMIEKVGNAPGSGESSAQKNEDNKKQAAKNR